jgi:hypothetical protein
MAKGRLQRDVADQAFVDACLPADEHVELIAKARELRWTFTRASTIVVTEHRVLFLALEEGPRKLKDEQRRSRVRVVDHYVVSTPSRRHDDSPWMVTLAIGDESKRYVIESGAGRLLVDLLGRR